MFNSNTTLGFHKDDEADVEGKNIIGSLSFGATRTFVIRNARDRDTLYDYTLNSGIASYCVVSVKCWCYPKIPIIENVAKFT